MGGGWLRNVGRGTGAFEIPMSGKLVKTSKVVGAVGDGGRLSRDKV